MAGDDSEANLFAVPDLWRTSKWTDGYQEATPATASQFFVSGLGRALDPFANTLKSAGSGQADPPGTNAGLLTLDPIAPESAGFFKLPTLDSNAEDEVLEHGASDASDSAEPSISDAETTEDVWMQIHEPSAEKPGHRTWDAFASGTWPPHQPQLISEAGPAAYDALLCWAVDPLELNNVDVPVVDAMTYVSSLLARAVGRESVLFLRDDSGDIKPALPTMRVSGYSMDVLQGLESQCVLSGSIFMNLRSFVQDAYSTQSSHCRVALASAVDQVLQVVTQHVGVDGRSPRSILKLQSTIRGVLSILKPFQSLTSQLRRESTNEDILSLVFHQACSVDYSEDSLREIMQHVLSKVSQPWIEFLEEWIGTKREEGISLTKSDIGQSKWFVKVDAETYIDDFGQLEEDVDFRLDRERLPDFMPDDVAQSVFETGRNLRFIRSFHPRHALAQYDTVEASQPPKAQWLYDWDSILRLESRVADYRDRLLNEMKRLRSGSGLTPEPMGHQPSDSAAVQLEFFVADEQLMQRKIQTSIDEFSRPIAYPGSEDSLSHLLRQRLHGTYRSTASHSSGMPHSTLLPLLSFGGLAAAQARIVNQEALRLLFSAHDLREHMKLQRQFHLLGNGLFCTRLSHALFDPNLETAERVAGVAREGGVMGLRLGGRDNWPPASSELRLALMGLLSESYESQGGVSELPGDLSFGVRDLSSEEIDKCMDPNSLEALDFLRLSYKAPPELAFILTPMILMQYDRIFKHLLRMLRMNYVVNELFRDINARTSRWDDPGMAAYRFVTEAHHFVCSVTAYFLETGVGAPWKAFESKLDLVQESVENPSAADGAQEKLWSPEMLREYHSHVLDRIMLALFLRKRQQPVLKLLEEILGIVLQFAKYSRLQSVGGAGDATQELDASELYRAFKRKVQVFVTVCRGLTEKARMGAKKPRGHMDEELKGDGVLDGIGDDSMVAHLLTKLDLYGYYLKR